MSYPGDYRGMLTAPAAAVEQQAAAVKNGVSKYIKVGIGILVAVLAISLASRMAGGGQRYSSELVKQCKDLLQRARRLGQLADQDTDAAVALMHSSNGLGSAEAARQLLGPELSILTGQDADGLIARLEEQREAILQYLSERSSQPASETTR